MQILKNPWKKDLLKLTQEAKHSVRITSPFVKHNICKELLNVKNSKVSFELITSFKLANAYHGALDISGLELILNNGGVVKNYPKLHAKIYIFDEKKAIITSGNLTNGGVIKNFEYGILLSKKKVVQEILCDFDALSLNSITGIVRLSHIEKANAILSKVPKNKSQQFPSIDLESPELKDNDTINLKPQILSSLNGWKLEVFKCIDVLSSQKFNLDDIYSFENQLKMIYPKNTNIKAKIRQQIQFLRDLGLIEFLNQGEYLKLWN